MSRRFFVSALLATLLVLVTPRMTLACAVCFGNSDSPLAIAVNNGVLVMLGFVAVMLSAFAAFFVYLARRARRYASTPQEGNAQC